MFNILFHVWDIWKHHESSFWWRLQHRALELILDLTNRWQHFIINISNKSSKTDADHDYIMVDINHAEAGLCVPKLIGPTVM